ncbi:glycoside hydrolase family 88/105 protein [Aridibaculum aurantiacum]|uniref:glycoside hydrolase family 88/105 protein n=1 Tax=Aridibaculum aurantiacum TaxID=2810307 RepID=UPI001A971F81|nr:glycoside hydrolase family 88 protein [Aridibaculum aurantiacum]
MKVQKLLRSTLPSCRLFFAAAASILFVFYSRAQVKTNDVTTPLHLLKPDYKIPYGAPAIDTVKKVLDRVYTYLDEVTPAQLIDRRTNQNIYNFSSIDTNTVLKQGDFRLTSYEWGVTYSAMLLVGEATGDERYTNYTRERVNFLANAYPHFKELNAKFPKANNPLRQPVSPHALDDAGAVAASMIKTLQVGGNAGIRPLVNHLVDYVYTKEFRLPDGTLARNRPQPNTIWLDDLYMSVPAIAQMGKLTGDKKYYDDAVKQILLFSKRMFNKDNNLYMHGWVQEMKEHPQYHWARANGWAIMAMVELLDVLPTTHPGYKPVLQQLQLHAKGLKAYQSGEGFWHQLIDKNDSYLETSATAIYAYCFARAINKGWIDAKAYAPAAILAWNAVATKVNDRGQVEGTCVGTGMAFDPAFYYYRPINVYAAHGYGPVLLAGGEIITLLKNYIFEINDSSLQLKNKANK